MKTGWRSNSAVLLLALASQAAASAIQEQPPEKLFAAICSTCHGAAGLGGISWIDRTPAPRLAGINPVWVVVAVRSGFIRSMPSFGPDQITDAELRALAEFLMLNPQGVPRPKPPAGSPVRLDILDADPWYRDDGTDLAGDTRRVALKPDQYLQVINTGRTWHTITADAEGKDSGFIGYDQFPDTGYYYAEPGKDLAPGCVAYHCHLHPYMQTEICTAGSSPGPLTRANKNPLPAPAAYGTGEIWVDMQLQEEEVSDPVDGAMQVIDAGTWSVAAYIPNVGNNPHSAWSGKDASGRNVVVATSWHDNILSLVDADTKQLVAEAPSGAAAAHIQVSPRDRNTWIVTHHGGANAVERVDIDALEAGRDPIAGALDAPWGAAQSGPHGLWFCDDGKHFVVANSFSNSLSLYDLESNTQQGWAESGGKFTLNPSVMAGDRDGCKRAYVTNGESDSISLFDVDVRAGRIARRLVDAPMADANGNLALTDVTSDPVRWTHTPMQSVVSPPGSTTHGRYMVVANKESFNVSIVALDDEGIPFAVYDAPAGLGAHGVAFGRKQLCDTGNPADVCYFAYVACSFEDYLGVYDLEKIENGGMGVAGSSDETLRLEGGLANLLARFPGDGPAAVLAGVPITVVCPDCRGGVHAGDVPLRLTTQGKTAYLKTPLWVDDRKLGGSLAQVFEVDLEVTTNTGGFGVLARPGALPW